MGDLQAEQAVPSLVAIIEYNENVEPVERNANMPNALIAAKLAEITGHAKGEWFYRNFWSDDVKRQAAEAYTMWAREHRSESQIEGT